MEAERTFNSERWMILGLFGLVVFAMQNPQGQATSQYRITHTYTLGGDGRWDYVTPDPANHRVCIARQNRFCSVDDGVCVLACGCVTEHLETGRAEHNDRAVVA